MTSVNETESVKKVVLTSSCAAIYTDCVDVQNAPNKTLNESIWNTTASIQHQPYSNSKTLTEKKAWEMNEKQNRWKLVVLNPSMVLGPATNPHTATSESFSILKQIGDGTLKQGAPNIGVGIVDVRDLADALLAAAFSENANGRNIISGHNSNFLDLAQRLHKFYGKNYKIPNKAIPKWLLFLVGPMVNKALTRKFIKNNVNYSWSADNSKSKKELGINYTELDKTLVDSFEVLIENKLI